MPNPGGSEARGAGPERKGRGAGLSRERVLEAAVALVDRAGLDALTMRALAEELGVEAMSLYRYVSSKDDLLDGVHARILGELAVPERAGPWREVLRDLARAFRSVLEAHPNALLLFATRPAVAPGSVALLERTLRLLFDAGFGDDALHAVQAGISFVVGHTLWRVGAADPEEARRLARLARTRTLDPDEECEYGLDALLLGLEAKLRRRRRAP
jgi:AcrR family transcriptional regulator